VKAPSLSENSAGCTLFPCLRCEWLFILTMHELYELYELELVCLKWWCVGMGIGCLKWKWWLWYEKHEICVR